LFCFLSSRFQGFSTYAKQPSWQLEAVGKYLSAKGVKLPPSKDFTKTNRGFPDVAAQGWNIIIELSGQWAGIGGTSARWFVLFCFFCLNLSEQLSHLCRYDFSDERRSPKGRKAQARVCEQHDLRHGQHDWHFHSHWLNEDE
jgi:hypothetical protein